MEQSEEVFVTAMDDGMQKDLAEMVKWTMLLSIFGFVFLGLMVLLGIGTGIVISNLAGNELIDNLPPGTGTGVIIFFTVLAGVLFYPNFTLYRYSVTMKKSLYSNDRALYSRALKQLKNMFKYTGIMIIAITVLLILDIAISVLR